MSTQKASQKFAQLNNIISAYADITADIMLNKNLEKHLKNVLDDIYFLNYFIEKKEKDGGDTIKLRQISKQLSCVVYVIIKKQKLNLDDLKK